MVLLKRQSLLQYLYDGLSNKSCVLTNCKVESVEELANGVTVRTSQGKVYMGQVVAGADGVHSRVRDSIAQVCGKANVTTNLASCMTKRPVTLPNLA